MKIRILTIFIALAAEIILAVIFFSLIPEEIMPLDIRWLDFVVLTIINAIFILNILFPLVNMHDKSHKEVAGLGLQWSATGWYTAIAVLFMGANILYTGLEARPALSFGIQATIQGILLLLFAAGIVSSQSSIEKAKEVYASQSYEKRGKADIKAAVAKALYAAEDSGNVPAEVAERLKHILADTRYLSPSDTQEAKALDHSITENCEALAVAFIDYNMNGNRIAQLLASLENNMKRRRAISN